MLARLVPTDEHGPGAREAGVLRYIERALASEYREDRDRYADGLREVDEHASKHFGLGFCDLAPEEQDAALSMIEKLPRSGSGLDSGGFFELVRGHALEGMFGDPVWSGNIDQVGWDLLGYPGVREEWTERDQRLDAPVRRVVRRSEDGPQTDRRAD